MRKLSQFKVNEIACIKSYLDFELEVKLLEFGLNPNSKVEIINITPFYGPVVLQTENGKIALRREEADQILAQ